MPLMFIITIVFIVALVGSLPCWQHSKNWGYYPIGVASVAILVVLVLLFVGKLSVY